MVILPAKPQSAQKDDVMKFADRLKLDKAALRQETQDVLAQIRTDLAPLVTKMKTAHKNAAQLSAWYRTHATDWIVQSVEAGNAPHLPLSDIAGMVVKIDDTQGFHLLDHPLAEASKNPPNETWSGNLTGRNSEEIFKFNKRLKKAGEKIQQDAVTAIKRFETDAEKTETGIRRTLTAAHEFYAEILQSVAANNPDRFAIAMAAPNVPEEMKMALLEAKGTTGQPALATMAGLPFASLRDEASFMQKIADSFENEFIAMRFLSSSARVTPDAGQKARFASYHSGFVGTVIPVDRNLINTNSYSGVSYANGRIRMFDPSGKTAINLPRAVSEAQPLLDAIGPRSNMIPLGGDRYMNANMVALVRFRREDVDFIGADGKLLHSFPATRQDMATVQDNIAKRGNFVRADSKIFINTSACAAAGIQGGVFRVYNSRGKPLYEWRDMPLDQSIPLLETFSGRPGFVGVNPSLQVNAGNWAEAVGQDNTLILSNSSGSGSLSWKCRAADDVQGFMTAFAARPGAVRISADTIINPGHWDVASREPEGRLRMYHANALCTRTWEMGPEQAQVAFTAMAENPYMVKVGESSLVNGNRATVVMGRGSDIKLHNAAGKQIFAWEIDRADMERVLADFAAQAGYIGLTSGSLLNVNRVPVIGCEKSKLKFYDHSLNSLRCWEMNPDGIASFRQTHRLLGQMNALRSDFSSRASVLTRALRKGEGQPGGSVAPTGQDFMPLMAAAFLIASSDPVPAQEEPDHGAGFTGDAHHDAHQDAHHDAHEPFNAAGADTGASGRSDQFSSGSPTGGVVDAGYAGGGGGGGSGEISSDITADPMFASLAEGRFGRGRFGDRDFILK